MIMAKLNIISLNVKGINDIEKRLSVFNWLKNKNTDICLLQETHSTKNEEKHWCKNWGVKYSILMAAQGQEG